MGLNLKAMSDKIVIKLTILNDEVVWELFFLFNASKFYKISLFAAM